MKEYDRIQIQDICSRICSGGTPKSTVEKYYGGNIPWLNTKEVNFNRIHSTERTITEEGLQNSSAKWIDENAVIVAMYGATAGKSAISKIRLTTNQACCNLNIDPDKADYRFVYYALYNDYSRLASLANGGAQQNLNAMQIKEFEIPYPSIEEQTAIANFLSALDDKIEVNRQINDNLEQQAEALYKSWFIDFEPFSEEEFIESSLGSIPTGWKVGELNDVCEIVGGGTPSKNHPEYYCERGIAWLTPKDLSVSKSKFSSRGSEDITPEGYKNSSTKLMPRGTVLFSSRAPIGYISIATNEICTNQGFKSAVPGIAGTGYLYYFLKANTDKIESKASGSTFKEASGALMKSLEIIIPADGILNQFEAELAPILNKQENIASEIQALTTLRDTLLPKLMSGELKINEIDC